MLAVLAVLAVAAELMVLAALAALMVLVVITVFAVLPILGDRTSLRACCVCCACLVLLSFVVEANIPKYYPSISTYVSRSVVFSYRSKLLYKQVDFQNTMLPLAHTGSTGLYDTPYYFFCNYLIN